MTDFFTKPDHKNFAGRVIDGPFEGEWIESDSPYFGGQFSRKTYSLYTGWPAGIEIDRVIYKWLPGYRAWAWWQRSAPAVPAKQEEK